jgi:hypothetical protein
MRRFVGFAAFLMSVVVACPGHASSIDSLPPDQQTIDTLLAKADQAQPREQCFLYAEVVHQMTELSIRQYAAGNVSGATGLLKRIQEFSQKIHLSMAENDKRMKNAEILLSHTAFRLTEMLHSSNAEDQALVKQTLTQVTQAQNEALMQVFQK